MDIDAGPKVMTDDGEFHATDEAVDLSQTTFEGWAALGLFWLLGATVFYQFFTRYVLNDSAAWTEEIARYLLIGRSSSAPRSASRRTTTSRSTCSTATCRPASRRRWRSRSTCCGSRSSAGSRC